MSKQRIDQTTREVRAELEERYARTFGCPAAQTPWGASWREVLDEAKAADEAYDRAEKVLTNLRRTLSEVHDFVRSYAPSDRPATIDACAGMTAPQAALYGGFFLDDAPLANAMDFVSWANDLLTQSPMQTILSLPGGAQGFGHGIVAAAIKPHEVALALQRHLDATYRRGTTRRLLSWNVEPSSGTPPPERRYVSVIGGVPPRSPGTTEWRRATLVAILDIWPVRHPETGVIRPLSNTDIAVVSLLTGSLDEYTAKQLASGVALALREETKAINQSRKRRTLVTNFLHSKRWAPLVAEVEGAKQQLAQAMAAGQHEEPTKRSAGAAAPSKEGVQRKRRHARRPSR